MCLHVSVHNKCSAGPEVAVLDWFSFKGNTDSGCTVLHYSECHTASYRDQVSTK